MTAVEIHVDAPSIPAELEPGFRDAVDHCLVHNSLRSAPEVAISVRHEAVPAGGNTA